MIHNAEALPNGHERRTESGVNGYGARRSIAKLWVYGEVRAMRSS